MTDFRIGSLNPVCLFKGLLKDKGALDYSAVSITALRNRIAELDDIEQMVIDEMQVLEDLFKELIDLPDLDMRYLKKRSTSSVAAGYRSVKHFVVWKFRSDGNRVGDILVINDSFADFISKLPGRYQEVLVDFDNRKSYLNYLATSVMKERDTCVLYLDDYLNAETALAAAGCIATVD